MNTDAIVASINASVGSRSSNVDVHTFVENKLHDFYYTYFVQPNMSVDDYEHAYKKWGSLTNFGMRELDVTDQGTVIFTMPATIPDIRLDVDIADLGIPSMHQGNGHSPFITDSIVSNVSIPYMDNEFAKRRQDVEQSNITKYRTVVENLALFVAKEDRDKYIEDHLAILSKDEETLDDNISCDNATANDDQKNNGFKF